MRKMDQYDIKRGIDMPHIAARNGIIISVYRQWGYEGAYVAGKMLGRSKASVMRSIDSANDIPKATPYFDANKLPKHYRGRA